MPMTQVDIAKEQLGHPVDEKLDAGSPATQEDNAFLKFFEAMDLVPRDEHWDAFMKLMEERPMNQLPVEKNLFQDRD